jgi:hypothetical protein
MSDLGKRQPPQTPVYLYHGSEDGTVPFEHVGSTRELFRYA